MPRFNEKSLLPPCRGLAGNRRHRAGRLSPSRRGGAADSRHRRRDGRSSNRRRGDRGHSPRFQRSGTGQGDRGRERPEGPNPQRGRRSATLDARRDLGLLPACRDRGRHGRRQPRNRGSDRRPGRRSLGQSAAWRPARRGDAVGADLRRRSVEIDEILRRNLPRELARPVFFPVGGGWRTLAKAHMEAAGAPVKVVHGYSIGAREAREFARAVSRLSPAKLAATPGVTERRARTLPAAALMLDRCLKHLAPERVVFSALGLREGFLYSQLGAEEQYLDPLIEGARADWSASRAGARFSPELVVVDS